MRKSEKQYLSRLVEDAISGIIGADDRQKDDTASLYGNWLTDDMAGEDGEEEETGIMESRGGRLMSESSGDNHEVTVPSDIQSLLYKGEKYGTMTSEMADSIFYKLESEGLSEEELIITAYVDVYGPEPENGIMGVNYDTEITGITLSDGKSAPSTISKNLTPEEISAIDATASEMMSDDSIEEEANEAYDSYIEGYRSYYEED